MKIKDISQFRTWFKNLNAARRAVPHLWNEDYMGVQHNDESGFFNMYHGDKEDIYGFLRKEVEMAEDGQAIYEFVQNAADSNSSHFYMLYNEKYFLAINNGVPFTKEGIKSILNIGQSFGKTDPDKIGRYGIGFKLVHRLVGKSSGLDELLNKDSGGYRGPVLFSWSNYAQFQGLLNDPELDYGNIDNSEYAWLLKILMTNFPSRPDEQIKDIEYNTINGFPIEELEEFRAFLNSRLTEINQAILNSGTIFFIKLGEGKYEYLEKQKEEYLDGLTTSMHFLKNLSSIKVNEREIIKDANASNVLRLKIDNGSEDFKEVGLTEKRDLESDINFEVCFSDNFQSANSIKLHPNIYKYFPAVKEVNNLSLIIHSNVFELTSNRQNLSETPVNKNLLSKLSKLVKAKMDIYQNSDLETFKKLFLSILVSDNNMHLAGSGWQAEYFYKPLLTYITENIPTTEGNFLDNHEVIIKGTNLNIVPSDFGIDKGWFYWNDKYDSGLTKEAENEYKLNLERWGIAKLIENAPLDSINEWIEKCDDETYEAFLKEIESIRDLTPDTKAKISSLKLFKFSDGEFRSFNEIMVGGHYQSLDIIVLSQKTYGINSELENLGFITSERKITDYPKLRECVNMPSEESLYSLIAKKCSTNTLTALEKERLFLNFINEETKFEGVGKETLKDLPLFCDNDDKIKPLNELIDCNITTPSWLNKYKIKSDEYFAKLKPFLISEAKSIFEDIYLSHQDDIISELTEANEIKSLIKLYQDNLRAFFKEFVIKKNNSFFLVIEREEDVYQITSADKEARAFIDENCADNLFVLPHEFLDYNDEDGIVKADDLHSLILEFVDADDHKGILVDIVKYKAKYKFLQKLSEFRFNSEITYTKGDYEFKILDLACGELKERDYPDFRDKVIIETSAEELSLSEIPPYVDNIEIEGAELKLSEILPDTYHNSDVLSKLMTNFANLGLIEDRLGVLFDISSDTESEEIFNHLSDSYTVLQNAQQLAFLILYGKNNSVDFTEFKVETLDEEEWELQYDYYVKPFSFIGEDYLLKDKYAELVKHIKLPEKIGNSSNRILLEPYLFDETFVCPRMKSSLSDEEKVDFLVFIYKQWSKQENRTSIKQIDWSKINDTETKSLLGFNPNHSVYPSKYACESEVLPQYLIDWIRTDENKVSFLSDLGVWTERSVVVNLRKFLKGETTDFHKTDLWSIKDNKTMLFNSFEWLKENNIQLSIPEQFQTFQTIVEVINDNRGSADLIIQEEYDFEKLSENSTEWEEVNNYTIYLYKGTLPKTVELDEISDYVFYRYPSGDYARDDNTIYINEEEDKKKVLQKVAYDYENDFSFEDLWQLFGDETEKLRQKVAQLEQQLAISNLADIDLGGFSNDLAGAEQVEYNKEAREIVKEELENKGYNFTNGIGKYSTMDGVIKNGVAVPLVVKSIRGNKLFINPSEWSHLCEDNAELLGVGRNGEIRGFAFKSLLGVGEEFNLRFKVDNLKDENYRQMAGIFRYFSGVHITFPIDENVGVTDYFAPFFGDRKTENDISSDDSSVL